MRFNLHTANFTDNPDAIGALIASNPALAAILFTAGIFLCGAIGGLFAYTRATFPPGNSRTRARSDGATLFLCIVGAVALTVVAFL